MNYAYQWWEKARNSHGILTKPVYTKQLEERIKALEAGKKAQTFLKLETELTQWKKLNSQSLTELNSLKQQLAKYQALEVSKKNLALAYQKQKGKIPLEEWESQEGLAEHIELLEKAIFGEEGENKNWEKKLATCSTALAKQQEAEVFWKQELAKTKKELATVKKSFIHGSAIGNTHWIYWKNWAEQTTNSLKASLSKSETELLEQLELANKDLAQVRKSVKEADSIANRLEKELAEQQQELDFANSKIKNIQPYFQQVLAVIKKNVILREKGKLKEAVAQIQELMEWKKTPLNTESNTPAGEAEIPEASTAPKGKGKKATVEDESDEDLYTDPNQNNN